MIIHDIDDVFSDDYLPIEIHAWIDGDVGDKVYWKGMLGELWKSGYMDYWVSDVYVDKATCGLVISIPICDLEEEEYFE